MRIGTPIEVKNREFRVGLTPGGAGELVRAGHEVLVESGAGDAIGYPDEDYIRAGCTIAPDAEGLFAQSDLIVKVKEPQPKEIARLRPGQTLFTYLHLAPDRAQTRALMDSGATCIAYETVTDRSGRLPLLTPMSEVAGRLSVQAGVRYLEIGGGGSGILLGGVTGVAPARVVVIGGGVAGQNAAQMALGLGADVTILDRSTDRLRYISEIFGSGLRALHSSEEAISEAVAGADLVIGAVLLPGAEAPKVVSRKQVASMRRGSVIVDIAIDQGGCFETSRPTTHDEPVYQEEGVTHYCVTNMPAAVPRTSTQALTTATLPFVLALANKGIEQALAEDRHLAAGLNIRAGTIVHPDVRQAFHGQA